MNVVNEDNTGSDHRTDIESVAARARSGEANRLVRMGYKKASPRKPLTQLDARGKLLIEYMASGCPHDWIRQYTRAAPTGEDPDNRVTIEPGWPLTLDEAADALRIKRRNARWIASQPVFQKALAASLQALREGAKSKALHRVIALVDEQGEGKAADRKVQLQAAQAILGEAVGQPDKGSVNVTVNTGPQIRAGVVIRLRPDIPPTPLEQQITDVTDQTVEE